MPKSPLIPLFALAALTACKGSDSELTDETFETSDCSSATGTEAVVCAADNFLATLDDSELEVVGYSFDDSESKTLWSNLPLGAAGRTGLARGEMSDESLAAMDAFAAVLLSDEGYEDYIGILASDDYLQEIGGGSNYASAEGIIAIYGVPATTGSWMVQLGNHHMAYNVTFVDGVGYPTPNHIAAEPKSAFDLDGVTYAPVVEEGEAFVALTDSLSSTQLSTAKLSSTFSDVLLGPVEYGTGSLSAVSYPSGSSRSGLLASELDSDQLALFNAVLEQWVTDFNGEAISDALMEAYTSEEALADTYIAWAGSGSPDVDSSNTYFRIDGPRVWIELSCQSGVIVRDVTHYHSMYRDKELDYGAEL